MRFSLSHLIGWRGISLVCFGGLGQGENEWEGGNDIFFKKG